MAGAALLMWAAAALGQNAAPPPGGSNAQLPAVPGQNAAPASGGSNAQESAPAPFQFVPQVSVGVARTDNLTLATDNPEPQTVLELTPAFSLERNVRRFTADAAYRLEGYRYQQRHDSRVVNLFDGTFALALDPDNFFLDFGASRDRAVRDTQEPIPTSNLPFSDNLVNRDEYYAGPALQYSLGKDVTVHANYRHSWIKYNQNESMFTPFGTNFTTTAKDLSFDNYRKQRGLSWALRYDSTQADYESVPNFEYGRAEAELGFWVNSGIRLFASGGRESAWDHPSDPSLTDPVWEAGVAIQPNGRLSAELAAGERSFGASRRATLTYMLRRGSTALSYEETPTTTAFDRYNQGLLQPTAPQDLLTQPGSAERYIAKRLTWNWSMDLRRVGVSASIFDESRKQRTNANGTALPDQSQSSVNLSATWHAGVRTDFVLGGRRERREFTLGEKADYTFESFSVNHRVGAHTQASLQYTHSTQTSNGVSSVGNYSANLIYLLLTRTFGRNANAAATNSLSSFHPSSR